MRVLEFEKRIYSKKFDDETAKSDEWWHTSGADAFIKQGNLMMSCGIDPETILEIMSALYYATANEYGA